MENTILYHGSQFVIKKPAYGGGKPHNDYGQGFYCTFEIELAKEWACTDEKSGYANQYQLDVSGLSVMYLAGPDYHILNWMAILLNNRNFRISNDIAAAGKVFMRERFLPDTDAFDIIIGYRADDSYFAFANAFLNNTLSLSQLKKVMFLGKLGEQTMLKSKAAFERIQFLGSEMSDKDIYYPKRVVRDKEARSLYRSERDLRQVENEVYLIDIIRERWENDDARLCGNIS